MNIQRHTRINRFAGRCSTLLICGLSALTVDVICGVDRDKKRKIINYQ
jgi:hypothetical protein